MLRLASLCAALLLASACAPEAPPAEADRPSHIVDAFFALCPFADNGGAFNDAILRAESAQKATLSPGAKLTFNAGRYEAKWQDELINVTYTDDAAAVRCGVHFKHTTDLTDLLAAPLRAFASPVRDNGTIKWAISTDGLSSVTYQPANDTIDYVRKRAP